jgi:hypothetical protein
MTDAHRASLASARDEHHRLQRLLQRPAGPDEAVTIGKALLRFAAQEEAMFSTLATLIDPAAQVELTTDHREIAEDVNLLEWLLQTTPESPDIPVLASSLLQRMQAHVARDGRLLSRAEIFHESV